MGNGEVASGRRRCRAGLSARSRLWAPQHLAQVPGATGSCSLAVEAGASHVPVVSLHGGLERLYVQGTLVGGQGRSREPTESAFPCVPSPPSMFCDLCALGFPVPHTHPLVLTLQWWLPVPSWEVLALRRKWLVSRCRVCIGDINCAPVFYLERQGDRAPLLVHPLRACRGQAHS